MSFTFDLYQTLALAVAALKLGSYMRKKISILDRFCIPAPVIGGLVFAILSCILYVTGIIEFSFDETMRDVCMVFFFTCVGFQADLKTLKEGGKPLLLFSLCIAILITTQNTIAIGLSKVLGISPLIGLCAGSISLVGGHGTSGAFGPILESLGLNGATTLCIAAATYGLIAGGLIGGPIGNGLIKRKKLLENAEAGRDKKAAGKQEKSPAAAHQNELEIRQENGLAGVQKEGPATNQKDGLAAVQKDGPTAVQKDKPAIAQNDGLTTAQKDGPVAVQKTDTNDSSPTGYKAYGAAVFQLIIAVGLGTIVSQFLSGLGMTFPIYVGAMITATIMRNIGEYTRAFPVYSKELSDMSGVFLNLFLGIAMITLRLWQLAKLALPLLILLLVQTVFMIFYARFFVFHVMGRDYDAAIMSAGTCGLGLGASPTAMANMQTLCRQYVPSVKAFLIVPLVGGVILDFINSVLITAFINLV